MPWPAELNWWVRTDSSCSRGRSAGGGRGDRHPVPAVPQEVVPGAAERPRLLLPAPPLGVHLAAPPGLGGDHGRAELRPADGVGHVLRRQHEDLGQRGTRPRPARRGRRPRTRPRRRRWPRSAMIRLMASDLRPQPHSAAANGRPVTCAAYSAASGGFLLAMACTMPRLGQLGSTASIAGVGRGGWRCRLQVDPGQQRVVDVPDHALDHVGGRVAARSPAGRPAGSRRGRRPPGRRFHGEVRRLEPELPVQRPHAQVPGVDLAGQLGQPGLVGRRQHRGQQQLADRGCGPGCRRRPATGSCRTGRRSASWSGRQPGPAERLVRRRLGGPRPG